MRVALWTAALLRGIGGVTLYFYLEEEYGVRSTMQMLASARFCAPPALSTVALIAVSFPARALRPLLPLALIFDARLVMKIQDADQHVIIANDVGFSAAVLAALAIYLPPFRRHFAKPDPEAPPR
jgi:hypothetical protein